MRSTVNGMRVVSLVGTASVASHRVRSTRTTDGRFAKIAITNCEPSASLLTLKGCHRYAPCAMKSFQDRVFQLAK
jgi:hypothetical protein